jgi:ACR3 family arsenite transporter
LLELTTRTTSSITGTSISTPTTVASAAPDSNPKRLIAAATASSKKFDAPISAEGQATLKRIQPFSVAALLVTLVLLFAFQGEQILKQPLVIAMLAVPILIQVYFNSGLAYLLNKRLGVAHCVAGPSALIGASNFFELAVAAAISLFGFNSGAALATVVGVLIEVPVMLSVVAIVNRTERWYEARA